MAGAAGEVAEGEADLVGGFHTEYGSMKWGLFFVAEYSHMLIGSGVFVLLFLGGWDAPMSALAFIPGWIWLGLKTFFVVSLFIWVRATFPRFRYDQVMRLGWKVFIPLTLVWLTVVGIWMQTSFNIWK